MLFSRRLLSRIGVPLLYPSKFIQTHGNISHHRFSSLAVVEKELNYAHPFQINMNRRNEESFEIEILFANEAESKVTVLQSNADGTVGDLINGIREHYKLKGELRAYTLDKQELSDTVLFDDLEGSNFYIVDLTAKSLFYVNNQDVELKNDYEETEQYCQDIQLGHIQKQSILDFLKRVDAVHRVSAGTEVFSDSVVKQKQQRVLLNKQDLVKTLIEALPLNKNISVESEEQLMGKFQSLQVKYAELAEIKEGIDSVSHRQVKIKMSLGLLALLGQFAFVGVGTYDIWSWDIIEPIAYFQTSAGLIYLSTHFFKYQSDFSNDGFYDYLKKKQATKLYAKYQFDIAEFTRIEEELHQMEKKLKSMMLIRC